MRQQQRYTFRNNYQYLFIAAAVATAIAGIDWLILIFIILHYIKMS